MYDFGTPLANYPTEKIQTVVGMMCSSLWGKANWENEGNREVWGWRELHWGFYKGNGESGAFLALILMAPREGYFQTVPVTWDSNHTEIS